MFVFTLFLMTVQLHPKHCEFLSKNVCQSDTGYYHV